MKIHRQLMILVGLGMLLIAAVTVLSLQLVNATFSRTASQMTELSDASRDLSLLERNIGECCRALQSFVMTGRRVHMNAYESARAGMDATVERMRSGVSGAPEKTVLAETASDIELLKKKASRILGLDVSLPAQRTLAAGLLEELNGLQRWLERDLEKYREVNAAEMTFALGQVQRDSMRIKLGFLGILATCLGFLFAFVIYFHRKVSIPLLALWEGTEAISRGNLEYRMQAQGQGEFARLGERFNEMARQLKASYADLEQKLSERTHELASLDAVALTLSSAGTLKDMLDKSLLRILDSLSGIEPKGGVFLCEPGGDQLRLMSHRGLSPEFIQREATIRMGDCLCGKVAQTGELLFTEHSCEDPGHAVSGAGDAHAHIIIPIKSRGLVLGVVFLYPQKDFKLKPSDVQMLDAIGVQLGMAVENFRFYAEVKESSEKYWDLFENATDILFTMDESGRLTAVNRAAERFSGCSKVELSGMSVFDFLSPEGAETARKMLRSGFKGRQWTEFEVRRRDGSTAFVEVSVRKLLRKKEPAGYQVSARDVTEQKQLRELLVQAERLGAIGQIVVAVRHEVNNPLTTVIGNTELLMERYEGGDRELMTRLQTILNNALRIAEIVKQLQGIRKDKVVEYLQGIQMTDLKQK